MDTLFESSGCVVPSLGYSQSTHRKKHEMRNVWKGLTVGAFAGAAVGLTMDAARRAADASSRAAGDVAEKAKIGASNVAAAVADRIEGMDIPDKVETAAKTVGEIAGKGKDRIKETIEDADLHAMIEDAKDGVSEALDRGKKALRKN